MGCTLRIFTQLHRGKNDSLRTQAGHCWSVRFHWDLCVSGKNPFIFLALNFFCMWNYNVEFSLRIIIITFYQECVCSQQSTPPPPTPGNKTRIVVWRSQQCENRGLHLFVHCYQMPAWGLPLVREFWLRNHRATNSLEKIFCVQTEVQRHAFFLGGKRVRLSYHQPSRRIYLCKLSIMNNDILSFLWPSGFSLRVKNKGLMTRKWY